MMAGLSAGCEADAIIGNQHREPAALEAQFGAGASASRVFGGVVHGFLEDQVKLSNVDLLLTLYGNPTIWLNTKVAPPGQRPPLVVTPSAVTIYWHKGQQALPMMPYMFTKGGTGGTLSMKPSLANGEQSHFVQASNNGATLWAAFDDVALNQLSAGDHYNDIVITETDPVYGPMTYTVPVMVEVDEMLTVSAPARGPWKLSRPQPGGRAGAVGRFVHPRVHRAVAESRGIRHPIAGHADVQRSALGEPDSRQLHRGHDHYRPVRHQ